MLRFFVHCMLFRQLINAPCCLPQELSTLVKGFASLSHPLPPAWWDAFLAASAAAIFQFSPGQMSNLLLGVAKTGRPAPAQWYQVRCMEQSSLQYMCCNAS